MKKTKKNIISLCIVLVVVLFIMSVVVRCIFNVRNRMNDQVEKQMVELATQNAMAMEKQVASIHVLLDGQAEELKKEPKKDIAEKIESLKAYVDIYRFKRIGFIDKNGMAYTTDGYHCTLKDKTCFEMGMKGKWSIIWLMKHKLYY